MQAPSAGEPSGSLLLRGGIGKGVSGLSSQREGLLRGKAAGHSRLAFMSCCGAALSMNGVGALSKGSWLTLSSWIALPLQPGRVLMLRSCWQSGFRIHMGARRAPAEAHAV